MIAISDMLRAYGINTNDIDIAEERLHDTIDNICDALDDIGVEHDLGSFQLSDCDEPITLNAQSDGTNIIIGAVYRFAIDKLKSISFLTDTLGLHNFNEYLNAADSHISVEIPSSGSNNTETYNDANIGDAITNRFCDIAANVMIDIMKYKFPYKTDVITAYEKDMTNDLSHCLSHGMIDGNDIYDCIQQYNDAPDNIEQIYDNLSDDLKDFINDLIENLS